MYPPSGAYSQGILRVPTGHALYYEQHGSADGIPAVVLHGGPGSGCRPELASFFDPERWRVVLFDQRGCGRSTPAGELSGNNTESLVEDVERLRTALGIERWLVFGGSWGATLALCYAQVHTARVLALVLRGSFLGRRRDRDWVFGSDGVARLFPEPYQRFLAMLPAPARRDPVQGYWDLLNSESPAQREAAAQAWSDWEDHVALQAAPPQARATIERPLIACHYARNDFFLDPEQGALPPPGALDDLPGYIIHGSRDLVCPLEHAYVLHRHWRRAQLDIVADAGHLASQTGLKEALTAATDALARGG